MRLRTRSARAEVSRKTDREIERETALKWAARAAACFQKHEETGDRRWRERALDYEHEALEHAALIMDEGRTVAAVQRAIKRERTSRDGLKRRRR